MLYIPIKKSEEPDFLFNRLFPFFGEAGGEHKIRQNPYMGGWAGIKIRPAAPAGSERPQSGELKPEDADATASYLFATMSFS
ncbi:MAG: hypothetical protein SRB2_03669 [Desulfobacteraceae bacterium Eth-SRB2]|nr:MAG: hypothetical protein SRB2_03669 [Desulfobacteraceae bacterium Eth-SRB2]